MMTNICQAFAGFLLMALMTIMITAVCILLVCFCIDIIRSTFKDEN